MNIGLDEDGKKRCTQAINLDAATKHGENLDLTDDEVAFYDALAANESAVTAMGDEKLKVITCTPIASSTFILICLV